MQDSPKIKAALEAVDALPQLQETLGSSNHKKDTMMREAVRRSQQHVSNDVAEYVSMIAQVPEESQTEPVLKHDSESLVWAFDDKGNE